jgi:hypothetical protein
MTDLLLSALLFQVLDGPAISLALLVFCLCHPRHCRSHVLLAFL